MTEVHPFLGCSWTDEDWDICMDTDVRFGEYQPVAYLTADFRDLTLMARLTALHGLPPSVRLCLLELEGLT